MQKFQFILNNSYLIQIAETKYTGKITFLLIIYYKQRNHMNIK